MSAPSTYGLHAAPGHQFCGPTAIAAVVGVSAAEVEQAVLKHRETHKPPRRTQLRGALVRTMWSTEVAPVCAMFGWSVVEHHVPRYTFAQWLRISSRAYRSLPHIVLVTGHFVAVSGHWFVDTKHREPIPVRKAPNKRRRVVRVWQLVPPQS